MRTWGSHITAQSLTPCLCQQQPQASGACVHMYVFSLYTRSPQDAECSSQSLVWSMESVDGALRTSDWTVTPASRLLSVAVFMSEGLAHFYIHPFPRGHCRPQEATVDPRKPLGDRVYLSSPFCEFPSHTDSHPSCSGLPVQYVATRSCRHLKLPDTWLTS